MPFSENRKLNIAQICSDLDDGGVERFIFNYCSRIHSINFIYIKIDNNKIGVIEKQIRDDGGNVLSVPRISHHPIRYLFNTYKYIKANKVDIVHCHLGYKSCIALFAAKIAGVPVRIAHAHIAFETESHLKRIVRSFSALLSKLVATHLFACGIDSAKWVWGKKAYAEGKVTIQNNAINVEDYRFSEHTRDDIRKSMGFHKNDIVFGNIGRLCEQKNQKRLLYIFKSILQNNPNSYLVLIGRKNEFYKLDDIIEQNNLTKNVFLLGAKDNASIYLNALDTIIFPSKYEGFPFSLLEKQCNGLRIVCSDNVTRDVDLTGLIQFVSLKESDQTWASISLQAASLGRSPNAWKKVSSAGYDIVAESDRFEKMYKKISRDSQ